MEPFPINSLQEMRKHAILLLSTKQLIVPRRVLISLNKNQFISSIISLHFNNLGTINKIRTLKFGDFQTPLLYAFKQQNNLHENNRCTLSLWPLPSIFECTYFMHGPLPLHKILIRIKILVCLETPSSKNTYRIETRLAMQIN